MARVTLSSLVRVAETGEVTTISKLASEGRVTFSRSANFQGSARGNPRVAYFADYVGGGCWEISKTAYESRMGLPISLKSEA